MTDLDAENTYREIDNEGMLNHVLNLPQTCADAWELGQRYYPQLGLLRAGYEKAKQIVVVGMGGSAIGGDLLAGLVGHECSCPIWVHRGYDLPAFAAGPQTLVIGSSHSGNTEETLSAFSQARDRGALLLALTTGGELARLSTEWGTPVLRFNYEAQPRAAVGYSFILLVNLLCHLHLISDKTDELTEALDVMRDWQTEIGPGAPVAENPAKRLAGLLVNRMPIVYGAGLMEPVARRWKTQFNENAKAWSFFEGLPELNHNAVVGFEMSNAIRKWATVILLRSRFDSPRIQTRWRITRQMLRNEEIAVESVVARGQSRLAQILSLIHFGDLVSVFVAVASRVNPTPVDAIAYLKEQLALGQGPSSCVLPPSKARKTRFGSPN
jgi:glucose/mannose-6-phosphate isomerase